MIGRAPKPRGGYGLPDQDWLNGLAGGNNRYTQPTAVAFAGGGQASATQIGTPNANGIEAELVELSAVATAGDSYMLPQAIAGKVVIVANDTANSADMFAVPTINKATGALDTINALTNVTALAIAGGARVLFFCPTDGKWFAIVSA